MAASSLGSVCSIDAAAQLKAVFGQAFRITLNKPELCDYNNLTRPVTVDVTIGVTEDQPGDIQQAWDAAHTPGYGETMKLVPGLGRVQANGHSALGELNGSWAHTAYWTLNGGVSPEAYLYVADGTNTITIYVSQFETRDRQTPFPKASLPGTKALAARLVPAFFGTGQLVDAALRSAGA